MIDQIITAAVTAVITAIPTAIALYVGFTRGTGKTIDIALAKIEARTEGSPTIKRLLKLAEMSEKLFADDQAISQITRFFKEAGDLVSSPEAKNFFKNATEALKEFSSGDTTVKLELPAKPKK